MNYPHPYDLVADYSLTYQAKPTWPSAYMRKNMKNMFYVPWKINVSFGSVRSQQAIIKYLTALSNLELMICYWGKTTLVIPGNSNFVHDMIQGSLNRGQIYSRSFSGGSIEKILHCEFGLKNVAGCWISNFTNWHRNLIWRWLIRKPRNLNR